MQEAALRCPQPGNSCFTPEDCVETLSLVCGNPWSATLGAPEQTPQNRRRAIEPRSAGYRVVTLRVEYV